VTPLAIDEQWAAMGLTSAANRYERGVKVVRSDFHRGEGTEQMRPAHDRCDWTARRKIRAAVTTEK